MKVIKISIKRQGQRFLGRRFHSIFYGWRQSLKLNKCRMQTVKRRGEKNKHLFLTPSYEGLGEEEPVLRKSKALLNSARNNKQPKRSSDSLSGDATCAAAMNCWSASTVTLNLSGDSPM